MDGFVSSNIPFLEIFVDTVGVDLYIEDNFISHQIQNAARAAALCSVSLLRTDFDDRSFLWA